MKSLEEILQVPVLGNDENFEMLEAAHYAASRFYGMGYNTEYEYLLNFIKTEWELLKQYYDYLYEEPDPLEKLSKSELIETIKTLREKLIEKNIS